MADWISVDEEWAYWINPSTLRMPRLRGRMPAGAVLVIKERLEQGVSTVFGWSEPEGLVDLDGKREASERLAAQALAYMRDHGRWPPEMRIKKAYKNGNVDLDYQPGDYDRFTLRLTPAMLGEPDADVAAFLAMLEPHVEGASEAAAAEAAPQAAWRVEPAKSGRARCRTCGEAIPKGSLRLGEPSVYEGRVSYRWHHLACRRSLFGEIEPDDLEGYDELDEALQQELWGD